MGAAENIRAFVDGLSPEEVKALLYDWETWARPNQLEPGGDWWTHWLILAGRGYGKSRTGAETVNKWAKSGLHDRIALIAEDAGDARDVMVEGEALDIGTPILTTSGWSTMGALKSGDVVFGSDGRPTNVLWCSDIKHGRPCYRVRFTDGSEIVADAEHKWTTQFLCTKGRGATKRRQRDFTTVEIRDTLTFGGQKLRRHAVTLTKQLVLPKSELVIDPYTLGVWLGDGTSKANSITIANTEKAGIIPAIESAGYKVWRNNSYQGHNASCWTIGGLLGQLRKEGVLKNKHVPEKYLLASADQRLALLQGLMDSDGSSSKRGQCEFDNTNYTLMKAVSFLLDSLGIRHGGIKHRKPRGLAKRQAYRISFTTHLPVFKLQNKLSRLLPTTHKKNTWRLVESVERVDSRPVRCIAVDADDHLYLAGERLVATHNSGIIACSPPWFRPTYEPTKRRLTWPNGAMATIFADSDPESLRGPQHSAAWIDEFAKFRNARDTWSNLMFGLRLGKKPRTIITTTPRPIPIIRDLISREGKDVVVTRGTTYENRANLAESFFTEIITEYEGTTLGRQELYAELIDPEEAGIIRRSWFKLWPHDKPLPDFKIVIQSYDTAFTDKTQNDPTACTVWGVFEESPGVFSVMCLDAWSDRMQYPDLRERVKKEYTVAYGDNEVGADYVLIEEKGSGISLLQDLRMARIPVQSYNPGRADKTQRLNTVSHLFKNGRVYLIESSKKPGTPATWANSMLSELCAFPLVEHDDYVDSTTQALHLIRDQGWLNIDVFADEPEYADNTKRRVNPYAS